MSIEEDTKLFAQGILDAFPRPWQPTAEEARVAHNMQLLGVAYWTRGGKASLFYASDPRGPTPVNAAARELQRRLDQWEAEHGKERGQ